MNVKRAWSVLTHALSSWVDDYAPSMGAALAYYTIFSIAPLLLIVIAVAGFIFGADAVHYSAQVFLVGAEFTWVYAHEVGSHRGQPRPRAGEALPAAASKTAAISSRASAVSANSATG